MKIKSMTATFGRLDRARLEPGEGLTLIQAPNEGGKSTWCAFWQAMLYGLDTRDRDRKGHLADKNRYQPWWGAPMEGEVELEWQGRDITLRRGPRGGVPFAAFSAVYTGTEEPVPGLTAQSCGELLTGAGREVFLRTAFIGAGGDLAVTAAPELEKRIAALASSGEEDVSFSQAEERLREWLNRRRVNKSVGLIPRLEEALAQTEQALAALEETGARLAVLEGERTRLEGELAALEGERAVHRQLQRRELNRRCAQAGRALEEARSRLAALEAEAGPLPRREALKRAQGELSYLKVLEEEIRRGEQALKEAEEAYVQAQIALQDGPFQGLSGEEADRQVRKGQADRAAALRAAAGRARRARLFPLLGLAAGGALAALGYVLGGQLLPPLLLAGLALLLLGGGAGLLAARGARAERARGESRLAAWGADSPQALEELLADHQARCRAAQAAADRARAIRGDLNDRKARRDNSRDALLDFVHTFAPQARDLFGCSAALSRALGLDHELTLARARAEERRQRREDLLAQGGRDTDCPEEPVPPGRTPQQTLAALEETARRLELVREELNQVLGRQRALGDPAALAARREELAGALARRREEYEALTLALEALTRAEGRLRQRFSPELNRLAGRYLERLTGGRYSRLTLSRTLEGSVGRREDLLPRSALYLSRGTADQLYLAIRLALCGLCLPSRPPLALDDALAAFDDGRLALALELLEELAGKQQILLFTCQGREAALLARRPGVRLVTLGE